MPTNAGDTGGLRASSAHTTLAIHELEGSRLFVSRAAGLGEPYQPSVNFPCSYWLISVAFARSVSLSWLSRNESLGLYHEKLAK